VRGYPKTYNALDVPKSVYVAAIIGVPRPLASLMKLWSMGTRGASGFTMTPSRRTARRRFALFNDPIRSPTPPGPADTVERSKLPGSELMNTSDQGHTPRAPASRDAYRNWFHLPRSNRSLLARMVVMLSYFDVCR